MNSCVIAFQLEVGFGKFIDSMENRIGGSDGKSPKGLRPGMADNTN